MSGAVLRECKWFHQMVVAKQRCGRGAYFDVHCIPSDSKVPMYTAICDAYAWTSAHPARLTEFWNADASTYLFTMKHKGDRMAQFKRCRARAEAYDRYLEKSLADTLAGDDPFTVDVPGVQDILKVKDWESPQLRRERAMRFKSANSAVPEMLRWLPPLLTKLDNAQDLLFTGLALAWPIIKMVAPRFLWPVSILLTINDIMNLTT